MKNFNLSNLRRISLRIFLSFFIILSFNQLAFGWQDGHKVSVENHGQDDYGVYIQFKVQVSGDHTDNYRGDVIVKYKDENNQIQNKTLFHYTAGLDVWDVHVTQMMADGVFRMRADNGSGSGVTNWSGFVEQGNTETKNDYRKNTHDVEVHVKAYLPNVLIGQWITFYDESRRRDNNDKYNYQKLGSSYYFDSPIPNTHPTFSIQLSTTTPKKMKVDYTYNNYTFPSYSKTAHKIKSNPWFGNNTTIDSYTDYTNVNPSGSMKVPMHNQEYTYWFFTSYRMKGGYMTYIKYEELNVPAYVWPESFHVGYDNKNIVKVSWDANNQNLGNGFVDNDQFELQRSTEPSFSKNVEKYFIDYKSSKSSYEFKDNITNISGGEKLYYRIRRTKTANNWGWAKLKETQISVDLNKTITGKSIKDTVIDNYPAAIVTWEPFHGVWVDGTTFEIKKQNRTTGASVSTFTLNEKEARSGRYIDKNIPYCNKFSYAVKVHLGNNYGDSEASIQGEVLIPDIGTIDNLTASKGYFPDRTQLKWQAEGSFEQFIVRRKEYDAPDEDYIRIAEVTGNNKIQIEDEKGKPGIYYKYAVVGMVTCDNKPQYSEDTLYAIGFRAPTGDVYGKVTFENGQGEEGVAIRLENKDQTKLGTSVYLNGQAHSFLEIDSLKTPFSEDAFTFQTWIKPEEQQPENQVIFSSERKAASSIEGYEMGFDANGNIYFSYQGKRIVGDYQNEDQDYVHITGIHHKDTLKLMWNDSVMVKASFAFSNPSEVISTVYFGKNTAGNNFKGYIDEIRAWNKALTPEEVGRNYTLLLSGKEEGLVGYWRLDEAISNQFFDLSHQGTKYNKNDGRMDADFVSRSAVIPTPDQLALKAYTDSTGNYMVSGIPYYGQGSSYAMVPLFRTHQFNPISVTRLFSDNSPSFTVNFEDKSSFKVTGYVYYYNTTVPVPDVQFKIDGQYAQSGDGSLIQTATDGSFSISVPVGQHQVKAVKANHVFVNDGKLTDRRGKDRNYQDPAGPFTLYDSTTVKFIGRVAGGAKQEAFPVGFSLSENNLGEELSVTLTLPTQGKYNLVKGSDSTVHVKHLMNGGTKPADEKDASETTVEYTKDKITITPDAETGEFEVNLIPVKFLATPAATGWNDWSGNYPISIDLTNQFIVQNEIDSLRDSTFQDGSYVYFQHDDTVSYHYKQQFIQRVTPSLQVAQVDVNDHALSYFGDKESKYLTLGGEVDTIDLLLSGETGIDQYLLGNPVFTKGKPYRFKINAFEAYPFYVQDGAVVKVKEDNGEAVIDKVPTSDGEVHITNKITDGDGVYSVGLDAAGIAFYDFSAGNMDFSTGKQNLSINVTFGKAENVEWKWNGNPNLSGFVLGQESFGNDFVTTGPNQLIAVLRDPPGSNSYSYYEKGTSYTFTHDYTQIVHNENNLNTVIFAGAKVVTFAGLGAGVITETKAEAENSIGATNENHTTWNNTQISTTTLNTTLQTSGAPSFVGPDANIYFGNSTNIIYGQSNNLIVIDTANREVTDEIIYPKDPIKQKNVKHYLINREGLNFGQTFATTFAYTQKQIIETEIPRLENLVHHLLLPKSNLSLGQALADAQNKIVYVSKLDESDMNFGKANENEELFEQTEMSWKDGGSYKIFFPNDEVPTLRNTQSSNTGEPIRVDLDSIYILNQAITQWKQAIADNEERLLKDTSKMTNYSFSSGSPIDKSQSYSTSESNAHTIKVIAGITLETKDGLKFNGGGVSIRADSKITGGYQKTTNHTYDTTTTQGYHLDVGGTDDYLSVDVADPKGIYGFGFHTRGGATSCPYEPTRLTKYYKPGTVIGQPTISLEIPKLSVDNPVANDIPSTRKASYTLQLSNQSGIDAVGNFTLEYANTDSVKGATISVDGASIASGRSYAIEKGKDISVELTLEKGVNAMDYNEIPVILRSSCQSSLADTVFLTAHFVPSCSDIHVKSPSDQWILNTVSPENQGGKRYVPITLNNFDKSHNLFDRIELQYKPASNSEWVTEMRFYGDSSHYNAAEGKNKAVITDAKGINYNFVMDEGSFSDQRYDIRALAVCKLGPGSEINTASNVVSGIKDTYEPRIFGTPQPANGVLGLGDNIKVRFNEPIAAGLLTSTDFHVTGVRNGAKGNHAVSVRLDGQNDYIISEFEKNFIGKDITAEMWVLPDDVRSETVFSHGNLNESMELAFTTDNHLQVTIGNNTMTSRKSMDAYGYGKGEWAHVALEYDAKDSTVSAFYNFEEVITKEKVGGYQGSGPVVFGKSISKEGNYFAGQIHDARIWTQLIPATTLQVKSLEKLSGAEGGLLAYYPLTEGRGKIVLDKAHGNNAHLIGNWSTPPGKAIALDGNGYVRIPSSTEPITSDMDYTMSLWFKTDAGQSNATLVSNGKGDGTDPDIFDSKKFFNLGFEEGKLTFRNNGVKVQAAGSYNDGHWHQVAIAVNRVAGTGRFYVDDTLRQFFDAKDLGSIESPYIYLGARGYLPDANVTTPTFDAYFNGKIDEFRLWNTYFDQTVLEEYSNVKLKGDELGLLYNYPFEKYYEHQGQMEMDTSLLNQIKKDNINGMSIYADMINVSYTDDKAPIKDRGPISNLNFDFVVNNDAVIINIAEPKQVIDKRIITLQLDNVRDLNGNPIVSPVTWTAYIDQNPLNWSDEELNLTKNLNQSMQFESYVVNSGGSNENFTISNLPPWLSADITDGTVAPKGKQKVIFTIHKGLNVGKYNEIAYMVNNNGQSQALSINIKVEGDTPDWEVDPAAFKYNMDIYGKIRINGIYSTNPEDMLAAFVDGKCIGMTYNSYLKNQDFWYAFLTIYSNDLREGNIEFRIWNASNGKVYVATPSQPISFVNDSIAGTPDQPVIFDGKELVFQNIDLVKGWNWISYGLISSRLSNMDATLSNGDWQSGDIVKHEERGFGQYAVSNGWVGSLSGFDNISLFKLKTGNAQTLSVDGILPDMKKIPIPIVGNRWNYIGYLPQVNMTLKEALSDYKASSGDQIKSQTGFAMYSDTKGWIGNLNFLEPGKGYMLYRKAADNTQFVYPSTGGSLALHRLSTPMNNWNTARLHPHQNPVKSNYQYASNMTLVAVPEKEFHLEKGDELLAFANGELRGKSKAMNNPITNAPAFFMNIAGESNQPIYFEIKRAGKVKAQSLPVFQYNANAEIGTLAAPYIIHFGKVIKEVRLTPNPFRKEVRIQIAISEQVESNSHIVQISVYNTMGQMMYHNSPKEIRGNAYEMIWNGQRNNGVEVDPGLYIIQVTVDGMKQSYKVIKQ